MAFSDKVAQFEADADIVHNITHGTKTQMVTTEGGQVPTIAKVIEDNRQRIDGQTISYESAFNQAQVDRASEFSSDQAARASQFNSAQSTRAQEFQSFLDASGFQYIGEYAPGLVVSRSNQYFTRDGKDYTLAASTVKPYTTTGDWATEQASFVLRGDQALRQELAGPGGAAMVGINFSKSQSGSVDGALSYLDAAVDKINATESDRNTNFLWTPPEQPNANGGTGSILNNSTATYPEYLALWDGLVAQNPDYITKTSIGFDQSGEFEMFKYVFEPPNPAKTIIITCMTHAYERLGHACTFLFMRHVANDSKIYSELSYLRSRCRIVVIPVQNPWGIGKNGRYNSRGVDLNRNFPYKWDEYNPVSENLLETAKGTEPLSEQESKNLVAVWDQYPDAVAHWDMHDVNSEGVNGGVQKYIGYHQDFALGGEASKIYQRIIELNGATPDECYLSFTKSPTIFNYAASRGMHSGNPEGTTDGNTAQRWSSVATTRGVGWYGNVILASSDLNKIGLKAESRVVYGYYSSGAGDTRPTIKTQSFVELTDFRISMPVECDGIINLTLSICGMASGAGEGNYQTLNIVPKIGHAQNYVASSSQPRADNWEMITEILSSKIGNLTVIASLPVAVSHSIPGQELMIGVFGKVSSGVFNVSRMSIRAEFIPSSARDKVKIFKATGRGGLGAEAMKQWFP